MAEHVSRDLMGRFNSLVSGSTERQQRNRDEIREQVKQAEASFEDQWESQAREEFGSPVAFELGAHEVRRLQPLRESACPG